MRTMVDPYFFHGHDFVRVLAPGPVHLSVRSLPDLFDSFVVPYCSGHVGPLAQTHTRRNRYSVTTIVITIGVDAVARWVLVWHLPVLQFLTRIGIVRGEGLVVEVRLAVVLLWLLLPTALVLVILMGGRIAII